MLLWPSLVKCYFSCMQEVYLCCVVAHLKGFWGSIDPPCKSPWFSEAERGLISVCAGLWRSNQGLVLWGCGAEATVLVPGFPCCAPQCRHAPYALSAQKVKLKKFSFGKGLQVLKNQLQQSWHQKKGDLAGGVNQWGKGASGEMFLLSMEHWSKSEGVGYKCQKMQNSAFE